jgi:hypothetical protein
MAAKHNDPATLQFVLTRKNVYDIENSLDLVQHSFLRHIFRYNADLVLQSLIQVHDAPLTPICTNSL